MIQRDKYTAEGKTCASYLNVYPHSFSPHDSVTTTSCLCSFQFFSLGLSPLFHCLSITEGSFTSYCVVYWLSIKNKDLWLRLNSLHFLFGQFSEREENDYITSGDFTATFLLKT